jgi:hypothetical protein
MKITLNEVKAMNKIAGTQMTKEQEIQLIKERLEELSFSSQSAFDEYQAAHKMRPDTKVKVMGKDMTVRQASKNKASDAGTEFHNAFSKSYQDEKTQKMASTVKTRLNKLLGTNAGYAQKGDGRTIEYNIAEDEPTYTLYWTRGGATHIVSLEPTYGKDPSKLSGKVRKEFRNEKDAFAYMGNVAKKYKKELEMQNNKKK